jgi:hypothetical protein
MVRELSQSQFRRIFGLAFNADIPPFLLLGKRYRPDVTFTRALGLLPRDFYRMREWLLFKVE